MTIWWIIIYSMCDLFLLTQLAIPISYWHYFRYFCKMKSKIIKNIWLSILSVLVVSWVTYAAISFPSSSPAWETAWWVFMSYFNKIGTSCATWEYLNWYDSDLNKICKPASSWTEIENVPSSMCYPITTWLCQDWFYMKWPGQCCPFKAQYVPWVWYDVPEVAMNTVYQNDPDWTWATPVNTSFVAPTAISDIQIWWWSDDWWYCYAWWWTDHLVSTRSMWSIWISINNDWQFYPIPQICDDNGGCVWWDTCPTPDSFDNNWNAQWCALPYNNWPVPNAIKSWLNLPAWTTIHYQWRHAIWNWQDSITCYMQVKYK